MPFWYSPLHFQCEFLWLYQSHFHMTWLAHDHAQTPRHPAHSKSCTCDSLGMLGTATKSHQAPAQYGRWNMTGCEDDEVSSWWSAWRASMYQTGTFFSGTDWEGLFYCQKTHILCTGLGRQWQEVLVHIPERIFFYQTLIWVEYLVISHCCVWIFKFYGYKWKFA